jgi:hypothetical protein
MRLSVRFPDEAYHSLTADTTEFKLKNPNTYLVSPDEMNALAQNLSDTRVFHWEYMTAVAPYAEDHCVLLVYHDSPEQYMCSIGSEMKAFITFQRLIRPLSGHVKAVLDEAASTLIQ